MTVVLSFVEWEGKPDRKKVAAELLKTKEFTPIPGTLVSDSLKMMIFTL